MTDNSRNTSKDETLEWDGDSWDFCDRSPCSRLIEALGSWIYGKPDTGGYVAVITFTNTGYTHTTITEIRYCPFCGTRLSELELIAGHEVYIPKG